MMVPVLPSNASPLRSGSAFDSRVLQEHSGNRQQADFQYAVKHEHAEKKYATSLSTENSYLAPQVTGLSSYPQREVILNRRPRGYGSRCYGGSKSGANKDVEAKRLYRRFLSSEKYAKYRGRQHKEDKPEFDQKWPDHMEEAFFRALVEWPPIGRRKIMWKEKQRGRNELIADYIESITGELRSRKQVSSHIQVLKPFVENDPAIMLYLSKEDLSSRDHGGQRGYPAGFSNGRGLSRYPVCAPPQHSRHHVHQPVRSRDQGFRILKLDEEVIELAEFYMFVQRKGDQAEAIHAEETQKIHRYTKQTQEPWSQAERYLNWERVASTYPLLSAMNSRSSIDCNVIAANASLFIHPGGGFKDEEGHPVGNEGAELGISFRCHSKGLPVGTAIQSFNSFYQGSDLTDSAMTDVQINDNVQINDHETRTEMQVMFGSTFWVRVLSNSFKNAGTAGSAFIQSITATQEIFAIAGSHRERILVIHWNFRLSKSPKPPGIACWKRVYLPSSHNLEGMIVPKSEHFEPEINFNDPMPNLTKSPSTLQSPFKCDSGSGSALSTSTWPTTISDGSHTDLTQDVVNCSIDNALDFSSASIDIAYDPHLSFEGFDTSTFEFDPTATEFIPDANMFSQPWPETFTPAFNDGSQGFAHEASFGTEAGIDSQLDSAYASYGAYDPQMYALGHETQAFGGAGQDVIKEKEALEALADASYLAQTIEARQGSVSTRDLYLIALR